MITKVIVSGLSIAYLWTLVSSRVYGDCPSVDISNGRVRLIRGGHIRYACLKPFIMVGSHFATCNDGVWSSPPPVCGRTNCSRLVRLWHGNVIRLFRGALVVASCDPGFVLIGSSHILCTENDWNDTMPSCQASSLTLFNMCHFEPNDLSQCNWIAIPALYKWVVTSSSIRKPKYPIFDHTHGNNTENAGHYLYLENSMPLSLSAKLMERRPDNGAKYMSPLFPAVDRSSEDVCLIFYIYCYGPTAGNVHVKINNDTVWKNTYARRHNAWTRVVISLNQQLSPFRIFIVGKGRLGEYSNTAIDDLRISRGKECLNFSDIALATVEPTLLDYGEYDEVTERQDVKIHISTFSRQTTSTAYANATSTQSPTSAQPPTSSIQVLPAHIASHVSTTLQNAFLPISTSTMIEKYHAATTLNTPITTISTSKHDLTNITYTTSTIPSLFNSSSTNILDTKTAFLHSLINDSHPTTIAAKASTTENSVLHLSINAVPAESTANSPASSYFSSPKSSFFDMISMSTVKNHETLSNQESIFSVLISDAPPTELSTENSLVPSSTQYFYFHSNSQHQTELGRWKHTSTEATLEPEATSTKLTDFEKSLIYVAAVVFFILLASVIIIIQRHRRNYVVRISDAKIAVNEENVRFLRDIELLDR